MTPLAQLGKADTRRQAESLFAHCGAPSRSQGEAPKPCLCTIATVLLPPRRATRQGQNSASTSHLHFPPTPQCAFTSHLYLLPIIPSSAEVSKPVHACILLSPVIVDLDDKGEPRKKRAKLNDDGTQKQTRNRTGTTMPSRRQGRRLPGAPGPRGIGSKGASSKGIGSRGAVSNGGGSKSRRLQAVGSLDRRLPARGVGTRGASRRKAHRDHSRAPSRAWERPVSVRSTCETKPAQRALSRSDPPVGTAVKTPASRRLGVRCAQKKHAHARRCAGALYSPSRRRTSSLSRRSGKD